MKTENLDFIEAVRAISEGRAEGAESMSAEITLRPSVFPEALDNSLCLCSTFRATDYKLINPKVPTEIITITRYALISKDGRWMSTRGDREKAETVAKNNGWFVVPFTVPFERPIPEPETVEYNAVIGIPRAVNFGKEGVVLGISAEHIGKRCRVIIEG